MSGGVGGSKAVWNFSENSSVLEGECIPKSSPTSTQDDLRGMASDKTAYIIGGDLPGRVNNNTSMASKGGGELDAEDVVQKVEQSLLRMEARVKSGDGGEGLEQKIKLVKRKLERYYFLRQLLPLSERPSDFVAFIEKSKVLL